MQRQAHPSLTKALPSRELRELVEADEGKDCNTSKALSKSLASLRNHPVRVADTESLLQLKFFGSFVCKAGALGPWLGPSLTQLQADPWLHAVRGDWPMDAVSTRATGTP